MAKDKDKRKYKRYDTEIKILFQVTYDIRTKVDYQVIDRKHHPVSPKYHALSKNVSAEGLCFCSDHPLEKGARLSIEVYLPQEEDPILMEGMVRWCQKVEGKEKYDTGVKLALVNGEPVHKSIYQDKSHDVAWSAVLENVLGNFRIFAQKRNK